MLPDRIGTDVIESAQHSVWRQMARARLERLLTVGSFARDTLISMLAGVAARLITLASLPLMAWFYAPADIGLWTIIASLAGYVVAFATLRFDIAVVIAPADRAARALILGTAISISIVALLLMFAVALMPATFWQAVSGLTENNQQLIQFTPALLILLGVQSMMQAYLTRRRSFTQLGVALLLQAIITPLASLGLLLVLAPSGATATIGAMLGLGVAVGALIMASGSDLNPNLNRNWRQVALVAARRYKVYPLYVLPYSLSQSTFQRTMQIVFVSAYSIASLGAFTVARQLMMAPAIFLASSLRITMFAHSAQVSDTEVHRVRVMRMLQLLIGAIAPAVAFGVFWLVPFVNLMMPPSWADVGNFAWWCMIPASMLCLVSWLDRLLDVLGRQPLSVALQLASDLILIFIVLASPWLGLKAIGMVALLCIAEAILHAIWLGVLLRLIDVCWTAIIALAAYALSLLALWGALQWAIKMVFPTMLGGVAAALLLLVALGYAAMPLARGARSGGQRAF